MKTNLKALCESLRLKAVAIVGDGGLDDEVEKQAEAAAMDEVGGSGPYFEDFSHEDHETLKAAFKDGFFGSIWEVERTRGEKALDVLARLHDGLSDMIEGGRLTADAIPDDYQWLVEFLAKESGPVFDDERAKSPAVKSECIHCPNCGVLAGVSRVEVSGDAAGVASAARELLALFGNGDVLPLTVDASGPVARLREALAGAPAVESAGELINRIMSKVNDETETWRGPDYLGADLAYLSWAIAEGPGNGFVEWETDGKAMVMFRHWFPEGDPVWQFIKVA